MAKAKTKRSSKKAERAVEIPKSHQWTDQGNKVLILKRIDKATRTTHNDFKWGGVGESVEAPDWSNRPMCGGGLHGWPWGMGLGEKAASSGDYSKAASSGDSSKARATGKQTIAMVAGLYGFASAGENGAFALPWMDGNQVRIAVGIVGEKGIKADTIYGVDPKGDLYEAK